MKNKGEALIDQLIENKVQFTEAEIANLPKWCQALERVEVEE